MKRRPTFIGLRAHLISQLLLRAVDPRYFVVFEAFNLKANEHWKYLLDYRLVHMGKISANVNAMVLELPETNIALKLHFANILVRVENLPAEFHAKVEDLFGSVLSVKTEGSARDASYETEVAEPQSLLRDKIGGASSLMSGSSAAAVGVTNPPSLDGNAAATSTASGAGPTANAEGQPTSTSSRAGSSSSGPAAGSNMAQFVKDFYTSRIRRAMSKQDLEVDACDSASNSSDSSTRQSSAQFVSYR